VLSGLSAELWSGGAKRKEHAMRTSQNTPEIISTIGIDVGNPSCNARPGHTSWHKAAEALATQCPELAEEADISPKSGNSRFDPEPT
jgi:hypothetical protein